MIRRVEFQIEGTYCSGCKTRIEAKVKALNGNVDQFSSAI